MNVMEIIFNLIGGLALFLFGMGFLSDGLKRIAGDGLRKLLGKITKWAVMALLVGAGVTVLIQSSSATTVMVVGLVNAGLLTLKQAIGVVLGANIGTTCTAWLVAGMSIFKISLYALPAIAVGFALQVLARRQKTKHLGQILLGFGLLFIGISFMKDAFAPLRQSQDVHAILIAIGDRPFLAIIAGAVITMLVQSSSASIMMIQTLAFVGAFGTDWDVVLRVTIPFILGDNIGTTITAQLAALRTNLAGKRTAMAHTLFNVLGVAVIMPLLYSGAYVMLVKAISPLALGQTTIMVHIAIAHTTFNVVAAFVMLPMTGLLAKIVTKILPAGKRARDEMPVTLEQHLLDTPPLAIQQARREIIRMSHKAKEALDLAVRGIAEDDLSALRGVMRKEDAVDEYQTQITQYLVEVSQRQLDPDMANELPVLMHSVNDMERVADHAVNIAEIAERKIEHRQRFSDSAEKDLTRMRMEVSHMFDNVLMALENSDQRSAERALEHEEAINEMQSQFRGSHIRRLQSGTCDAMTGLTYIDFVNNMEKIGDHLSNIAQGVIYGGQWGVEIPQEKQSADADPPNEPADEESL